MLEFAGSMVILVLLYLVIITIGLRLADLAAVNKATRDGGRQAAISGSLVEGEQKGLETAWVWGLDVNRFTINLSTSAYGGRNVLISQTEYRSSPFARLFPTMTGNTPVDEKTFTGTAFFGWWDYEH
jgi:hypothetical protein